MNQELKDILIKQSKKYPDMNIQDFLKLIFQQTFGPRHFNLQSDFSKVKTYLLHELEEMDFLSRNECIESIGNGYFRIYLDCIKDKRLSEEKLADMFYQSMIRADELSDSLKQQFIKKIEDLLWMIEQHEIKIDEKEANHFIKTYLKQGIQPLHHSNLYREIYNPHYRVVHQDFIPDYLFQY